MQGDAAVGMGRRAVGTWEAAWCQEREVAGWPLAPGVAIKGKARRKLRAPQCTAMCVVSDAAPATPAPTERGAFRMKEGAAAPLDAEQMWRLQRVLFCRDVAVLMAPFKALHEQRTASRC